MNRQKTVLARTYGSDDSSTVFALSNERAGKRRPDVLVWYLQLLVADAVPMSIDFTGGILPCAGRLLAAILPSS